MKNQALYEIRYFQGSAYSRAFSSKLVDYSRARRVVRFLKRRRGMEAFAAKFCVAKG